MRVPFQGNSRSKVSPLAAIAHAHGIWLALSALATACPVHANVHSEHLFSFTEGTDIGTPWQAEGELEAIGRIVARPATTVMSTTASLKHRQSESFGLAPSTTFARFDIFDLPALRPWLHLIASMNGPPTAIPIEQVKEEDDIPL